MNIDTFINPVMTSGRPFAVRENRALSERQRPFHIFLIVHLDHLTKNALNASRSGQMKKLLYKKKIWNAKHSRASPREEIFLACSSSSIQTILSASEFHRILPCGSWALPPVGNCTPP